MRCGYVDDLDQKDLAMWRGRVMSALRGQRGQKLLCELLAALDAMPVKRLIANELADAKGEVCLLGAGAKRLGMPGLEKVDPEAHTALAVWFNVAECMIREIQYINDERAYPAETPERRYKRVRAWLVENISSEVV